MSTVNDPLISRNQPLKVINSLDDVTSQDDMLRFLNTVKTDVSFWQGRKFVKGNNSYTLQEIIDKSLKLPKDDGKVSKKLWDRIKTLNKHANSKLEKSYLRFFAWIWQWSNPKKTKTSTINEQLKNAQDQKMKTSSRDVVEGVRYLTTNFKSAHELFKSYGYDPAFMKRVMEQFNKERGALLLDEASMKTVRSKLIEQITADDIDPLDSEEYIRNVNDYLIGSEVDDNGKLSGEKYYQLGRRTDDRNEKIRYFLYAQFGKYHPQAANELEKLVLDDKDIQRKLILAMGNEAMKHEPNLSDELIENFRAAAHDTIREVVDEIIKSEKPQYVVMMIAYQALERVKEKPDPAQINDANYKSDQQLLDALARKANSIFGA